MEKCYFCQSDSINEISFDIPVCLACANKALSQYKNNQVSSTSSKSYYNKKDEPLENYIIGFGKHKGKKILTVEPEYIKWCLDNFDGLRDVDIFKKALEMLTNAKTDCNATLNKSEKIEPVLIEEIEIKEEDFPF
ncbi:MAG: hypothetical protein ACD_79C00862G0006 [uncultured bacterium]|nr:MAG: hypothetical protein ACD_79C00862G0006 [uncultured bacterium]